MTTWKKLRCFGMTVLLMQVGVGCGSAQLTEPCGSESVSFTAIWNADLPPTTLYEAEGLDDLLGRMQVLATQGLRLEDFEVWESYGVQHFAGLFRPGYGVRLLMHDLNAARFQAQQQQRFAEGLRLLDVEIRWVEGERRFSALWASGAGIEKLYDNLEANAFHSQWQELSSSFRLVDFETWWEDGELRVFGVFRSGYEETQDLVFGLEKSAFIEAVDARGEDGLRLIDVEIATAPGEPTLYSGRWVPEVIPNWWGIGYSGPQLRRADWLLSRGFGYSGLDLGPDSVLPPPPPESIQLPLLDLTAEVRSDPVIIQLEPKPDTGTAGPPR